MELLKNPLACPFCDDQVALSQEQAASIEKEGLHQIELASPTCGASVLVVADTSVQFEGHARDIALGGKAGAVVQASTIRVEWLRASSTKLKQIEVKAVAVEDDPVAGGEIEGQP